MVCICVIGTVKVPGTSVDRTFEIEGIGWLSLEKSWLT